MGPVVAIGVAASALTACDTDGRGRDGPAATVQRDRDGFNGTLVDPPLEVAPVTLRDTDGNPARLDRLSSGDATAIFFGFTNCDDVCPTTMADLAAARRALPADVAKRVSLVFITVDPQRDTPSVLRNWLDQFDADIVGFRGPVSRVHRAERSLYASESGRVHAPPSPFSSGRHGERPDPSDGAGHGDAGYQVNHTSVVYLFGPDGETLLYTGGTTPARYAADFSRLLSYSQATP